MNNSKIESLLNDINIDQYKTQKINDYITLTNYQIEVLKRYDIDYKKYVSLNSLIFEIEEILNEEVDASDLEEVSSRLSELNYYNNTNK